MSRTARRLRDVETAVVSEVTFQERLLLALKAMRMHQWAKNTLIALPPLLAHRWAEPETWTACFVAFVAFGLCASSVYLVNDIVDLESDRNHPQKRHRPFASGKLPVAVALGLVPALIAGGFAIALTWLPRSFAIWLVVYLSATSAYTFALNRVPILDILVLAGFYTLRLLAGGSATSVDVSPWLLAFSLFFFLSLAFLKRYVELVHVRRQGRIRPNRAGYAASDSPLLLASGVACGYLSMLVFALYTQSADVPKLYRHPLALWAVTPLLLYWINRVWFEAHRGRVSSDPVSFALKDPASIVVALSIVGVVLAASV